MGELANAMRMFSGNMGCHVIQYPTGKWGFVGTVPMALSYTMADGSPVSDDLAQKIISFGAGLFPKSISSVVFDTESEALAARDAFFGS